MEALRQRRAVRGNLRRETEEPEIVIPLRSRWSIFGNFPPRWKASRFLFTRRIDMPLLKRLGEANFVPSPGLEALLGPAYRAIQNGAIEQAFQETLRKEKEIFHKYTGSVLNKYGVRSIMDLAEITSVLTCMVQKFHPFRALRNLIY